MVKYGCSYFYNSYIDIECVERLDKVKLLKKKILSKYILVRATIED